MKTLRGKHMHVNKNNDKNSKHNNAHYIHVLNIHTHARMHAHTCTGFLSDNHYTKGQLHISNFKLNSKHD